MNALNPSRTVPLLAWLAVLGTGCDGVAPVLDTSAPVIDLLEPAGGSVLPAGEPFVVCFDVTENDQLHGWEILVLNDSTGRQVDYRHGHEHARNLRVTETVEVPGAFRCRLVIRADDHTGNVGEAVRTVRLME
jgi:hypothetical protein